MTWRARSPNHRIPPRPVGNATLSRRAGRCVGTSNQVITTRGAAWSACELLKVLQRRSRLWERLGALGSAWGRRSRLWDRLGAPGSAGAASASAWALGGPERPWAAENQPWAAQTDPAEASGWPRGSPRPRTARGGRKQALDGPKTALGGRNRSCESFWLPRGLPRMLDRCDKFGMVRGNLS